MSNNVSTRSQSIKRGIIGATSKFLFIYLFIYLYLFIFIYLFIYLLQFQQGYMSKRGWSKNARESL